MPCPRSRQPSPHPKPQEGLCVQPSSSTLLCRRSALGLARALGPLTSEVFGHSHGTAMLTEKDFEQLMT